VFGPESVFREITLVLRDSIHSLGMPDVTLVRREILPSHANDLGEGTVVGLNLGGHPLALDE
jgi:hypothetical protein